MPLLLDNNRPVYEGKEGGERGEQEPHVQLAQEIRPGQPQRSTKTQKITILNP